MKKISTNAEDRIVELISNWPFNRKFTWESVRARLRQASRGRPVWSRQALANNERISLAFAAQKEARKVGAHLRPDDRKTKGWYAAELEKYREKVVALTSKLNALELRHASLAYSVSLLPGGSKFLVGPLPAGPTSLGRQRNRN